MPAGPGLGKRMVRAMTPQDWTGVVVWTVIGVGSVISILSDGLTWRGVLAALAWTAILGYIWTRHLRRERGLHASSGTQPHA